MFKNRFGLALAAALVLLIGLVSGAGAEDLGVIKGSAKNLTADGASLAGGEVTLSSYTGGEEKEKLTSQLDKDGNFLFTELDAQPGLTYQLSFEHQGATYYSAPLVFDVDTMEHTVDLEIFDSTTDSSVVTSSARHLLLEPEAGGVHVSEIMILSNPTDKTYIGGEEVHEGLRETLRFVLPTAAANLEFGSGFLPTRTVPTEDGFVDTWPVFPGDAQRIFSYTIPSEGGSASFTNRINLNTDKVSVLMPDVGVQLSVPALPDMSNPDIQGSKYLLFSGQNVAAGTEITFTLDGLSAATGVPASSGGGSENLIAYLAGGGVIVIMAAALGIVTIRRRRRSASEEADLDLVDEDEANLEEIPEEEDELESERKDLIASIASLDDAYEQGRIGADEYGMLRTQQKDRLLEIVTRQKVLINTRGDQ